MFLNLIKGDISINTKRYKKIDFGDPIDKIHLTGQRDSNCTGFVEWLIYTEVLK